METSRPGFRWPATAFSRKLEWWWSRLSWWLGPSLPARLIRSTNSIVCADWLEKLSCRWKQAMQRRRCWKIRPRCEHDCWITISPKMISEQRGVFKLWPWYGTQLLIIWFYHTWSSQKIVVSLTHLTTRTGSEDWCGGQRASFQHFWRAASRPSDSKPGFDSRRHVSRSQGFCLIQGVSPIVSSHFFQ